MPWRLRLWADIAAWLYSGFGVYAVTRHFSGSPTADADWFSAAPLLACGLVLIGLLLEGPAQAHPPLVARILVWAGAALMCWRSLWMFFSWDGMMFFPVWCLLALCCLPVRPKTEECA